MNDLKFASRTLLRNPSFTFAAILALAQSTLLLRPLPYRNGDQFGRGPAAWGIDLIVCCRTNWRKSTKCSYRTSAASGGNWRKNYTEVRDEQASRHLRYQYAQTHEYSVRRNGPSKMKAISDP